ncbi:putative rhamnogalacturonate lyase C [Cladobotryum mycophilum]|uniref:Rhamnogalacturonate lyase C n=1 Tax=Cladobotryum mycophilum TaxID=491253 RepID=A0ABR0SRQ7_9HYPO
MASLTRQARLIQTRILIISDTHGMQFSSEAKPREHADVVIHCGDLTEHSKLEEFRQAIQLLDEINAPIKLVIAGNHDFTLDIPKFKDKISEANRRYKRNPGDDLVKRDFGHYGEAMKLLERAKDKGIIFLNEGSHTIPLQNGAILNVYASPYTPSNSGGWGFQYFGCHDFNILDGTDMVITHGPPHGILDRTGSNSRIGCPQLFTAVAEARPRIHCFGHVHDGWGAKLVTWRPTIPDVPTHFNAIDNGASTLIADLWRLKQQESELFGGVEKEEKTEIGTLKRQSCYRTSHCKYDKHPLTPEQTLFINAATMGCEGLTQKPWLVTIELPQNPEANGVADVDEEACVMPATRVLGESKREATANVVGNLQPSDMMPRPEWKPALTKKVADQEKRGKKRKLNEREP